MGNGVVGGIQHDDIPLRIEQYRNVGQQGVGLAIALAAVGKLKNGIAFQLKRTIFQIENRIRISIIDAQ